MHLVKEEPVSTRYSITDDAVARHVGHLDTGHAAMNAALNHFIAALATLPGAWKGASFQSFDQVQHRWQAATRDLNSALADIRGRVDSSAKIYATGEAEQTATLAHLAGSANWDAGALR